MPPTMHRGPCLYVKEFHDFFIIKGQVLGCVSDYFFKKEYQARGAPHILLWIDGAPVAGSDSDNEVLQWIQARITCRIPEENSNLELSSRNISTTSATVIADGKNGLGILSSRDVGLDSHDRNATLLSVDEYMKLSQKNVQASSVTQGN